MTVEQKNIIVLCRHPGVLLNYGALFNQLGYFNVSLCTSMQEVLDALSCKGGADYFLLDDFKVGSIDVGYVKRLSADRGVKHFLLVGDFRFDDKFLVFKWARSNQVSVLGMIKHPIRSIELEPYLEAI